MKVLLVIGLLVSLAVQPAFAECVTPPPAPVVPSGATASRDEMLAALQATKIYSAAVTSYAECVQRTGGNALLSGIAVDHMHKIADSFNAELRVYKARFGG